MNDRTTPETDRETYSTEYDENVVDSDFARKLERERDEAREQNAALRDALQTVRDEAFELAAEQSAMQNIAAIQKGIADLRKEYWALRDALRVRGESKFCPECDRRMSCHGHAKTCRHAETERMVMQ